MKIGKQQQQTCRMANLHHVYCTEVQIISSPCSVFTQQLNSSLIFHSTRLGRKKVKTINIILFPEPLSLSFADMHLTSPPPQVNLQVVFQISIHFRKERTFVLQYALFKFILSHKKGYLQGVLSHYLGATDIIMCSENSRKCINRILICIRARESFITRTKNLILCKLSEV